MRNQAQDARTADRLTEVRTRLLALIEQIDNPQILEAMCMLGTYAWQGSLPRRLHLVSAFLICGGWGSGAGLG